MDVFENPKELGRKFTWHDTAVGCRRNCGYCGHKTRTDVAVRPDDIVESEIRSIGEIGFEESFIIDPILGGALGRDKKILQLYKKYAPDTAIKAYYRAEFLDDETIDILSKSNIKEILVGIQSTNPNVPAWLRSNDLERVKKYLPQLSKRGIFSRMELIVGMPGDNYAGLRESMRFVIDEIHPMSVRAYHLTVIPGTPLHNIRDADITGGKLWIHADSVHSRATESNSYTHAELDIMLTYAIGMTSLYNTMKVNDACRNVSTADLERAVLPIVQTADEETRQMLLNGNMAASKKFWENKI